MITGLLERRKRLGSLEVGRNFFTDKALSTDVAFVKIDEMEIPNKGKVNARNRLTRTLAFITPETLVYIAREEPVIMRAPVGASRK